jgi:hypothetical protein
MKPGKPSEQPYADPTKIPEPDPNLTVKPINLQSCPTSELEARLVQLLGWEHYHFNFPLQRVFQHKYKKVKLFDPDLGKIRWVTQVVDFHQKKRILATNADQGFDLHVKYWRTYKAKIGLPANFETEFPYLYNILRDMFYTNIINKQNHKLFREGYDHLLDLFSRVIGGFWTFYRELAKIPAVVDHFRNHPEILPELRIFEDLVTRLLDPTEAKAPKKQFEVDGL